MTPTLPPALIRSLNGEPGFDEARFSAVHASGEQVTAVRLNPLKSAHIFDTAAPVPWCAWGKYLARRPSFTADPLFHAGCYYVQEASSMFLEQVLKQAVNLNDDLRVLDLCAAPGGKSTHLSSLLSAESLLVSNEIIKSRVLTLADNMSKWGAVNTVVTNNDPEHFNRLGGYFDVIVADAPCSGSGMFRKDPHAISEWSEQAIQLCSQRQKRILADIYPALKENGILIYSTCSYSREENEQIADWLCDNFSMETVKINVDNAWGISETGSEKYGCHGYRFYPHRVQGEGFFITCLRKTGEAAAVGKDRGKQQKTPEVPPVIKEWLDDKQSLGIFPIGDEYGAIARCHENDLRFLQSKLYLKKSGVRMGKITGRDLVPDHELAVSLVTSKQVNKRALTYEQAISYLKKADVLPGSDSRLGWTLMCYQEFALGWAKVLPNRINNYYPKELRILKDF
ncbi:methyltransferase RsmF C-terminal domain-like protein [Hufsiella ginkgonis]|uniref:RNA methyltransferase n=1 Tax=Hufsiella ginkgonis TaxID=2695274 RepID=A0A7K1XRX1_9SPHI|nr:RNA methyltransferase [Hufsiella ginkgonis]MXV13674.1 RNA methyltransferase [Hufsiella ginkgonis]